MIIQNYLKKKTHMTKHLKVMKKGLEAVPRLEGDETEVKKEQLSKS